jgi:glycogen operon protein
MPPDPIHGAPGEQPVWAGRPYPLGAHYDGAGTAFSVFSSVADAIELCLFDTAGNETRVELQEQTGSTWHGYLPGIAPGQRYGYRVHGPWHPAAGMRCNPNKLLLDPYAQAIEGEVRWTDAILGHTPGARTRMQPDDSAADVPRSVVVHSTFDWGDDRGPAVPEHEAVIYETHLKGFSMRHPEVPEELRGTYAGFGHEASVGYLRSLGVTSIELLPVQQFLHDGFLLQRGLSNYWGYNTIGFFAPHAGYASAGTRGEQVDEFKAMVKALHAGGLEVILDVVYNHSGEGSHRGPTLSFRGFDNELYYHLRPDDPSRYLDYTGTGNSLDARQPQVLQLIMDSLRYWILEMHVDGFRFDLATTLARETHHFDRYASFFDIIHQDPVIRRAKLIAEPWDTGEGGYQIGNFPSYFSEWNGRYRDEVRGLWRGEPDMLHDFGRRFSGSADLFADEGRRPSASINFVTAHDGFTLVDLVSYERKHNLANGENDLDGESHNRSWNCGVEGPASDPAIVALRTRQRRNLLATLLLSQGVPMLLGGDELGRTQHGNNNAYCQDSELTWHDWDAIDEDMLDFTRRLISLRRQQPVFQRRHWFGVGSLEGAGKDTVREIEWCDVAGARMRDDAWHTDAPAAIAVYLSSGRLRDERGEPLAGDSFYLALNAGPQELTFRVPDGWLGRSWEPVFDTANEQPFDDRAGQRLEAGDEVRLMPHSLLLLRAVGSP